MNQCYVEKYKEDDLGFAPIRFNNKNDEFAKLSMIDSYCMLFPENEEPVIYFRHANPTSNRFGGIIHFGEGPLGTQTSAHHADIAQKETPMVPYEKINDAPVEYRFGSEKPFSEFHYYIDHATWKEGNDAKVLDVAAEPFPFAFFVHKCNAMTFAPWMSQPCVITGTYEGKPVKGVGCYDRLFKPQTIAGDFADTFDYISSNCIGIREDGRKEAAFFCLGADGSAVAYYWLEGEEPIVSESIEFQGDWVHLPYTNDGTVVCTDFVWTIGEKEIHFSGKWGAKGFTETPRIDRHGQSQVFGTWYEGKTPYQHTVWQTFNENMEAFDYKLKERGFHVID